jgi:hypothetical protein
VYLIRVGNLTISLEHLILVEDARDEPEPRTLPPGLYRMTMETGRVLDLDGDRADCARELVDEVAIRRGGKVRTGEIGREIKPEVSGEAPTPTPIREGEEPGGAVGDDLRDGHEA